MFSPAVVLAAIVAYVALLFALAQFSERNAAGQRLASKAAIYSLGFSVYCTTWTYYGSVGNAAGNGMLFIAIYTGPTLGFLVGSQVLRRVTELKHAHRITSIADFISARYRKSRAVAAIVTLGLLVGVVPYVALQIKAVNDTFGLLTHGSAGTAAATGASIPQWGGPLVVGLMILVTIVFGIRRIDPTERHPGMIASLAIESFVKLAVLLAVGVVVIYGAFGGFGGLAAALETRVPSTTAFMGKASAPELMTWVTWTLLAMGAFFLLPRQFHVGVVENAQPRHVRTAMWLAPLYLFVINLGVLPIALGGKMIGLPNTPPDQYVLALPIQGAHAALSLCVFMGGFSAAIGMIMVETTTMATMISNHLFLPLAEAVPRLGFLRRRLLYVRWVAAAFVIWLGYEFAVSIGKSYMLISIGLLSFAAAFQLAPVVLGGLYWKRASRGGALVALVTGFGMWFYTLLMPTFVKSGWMSPSILADGPFGIHFLRPEALFGMTGFPQLVHGTMWTTALNMGGFIVGSLAFPATRTEREQALRFLNPKALAVLPAEDEEEANIDAAEKREKILAVLSRYYARAEAVALTDRCFHAVGLADRRMLSVAGWAALFAEVERTLAGAVGAAGAHLATRNARNEESIFGKYQLIGSLGRGGMADVFLARSLDPLGFNRLLVIKRLRLSDAEEPGFVDMFLDEARLAARLSHPNIVQTYEVGECEGSYFIAMQFLEGQPLVKLVEHQKQIGALLPPALWVRIVADTLAGLHYAQELKDYDGTPLGVVHRDVSPHNIFVTYQGEVKIVDFGIAKAALNTAKTEVGVVKGKVSYMAPEQATSGTVDRRADIFAVGIVLWEGVTGARLFAGETFQALHKLISVDIPRASSLAPNLDPRLDAIIARALSRSPEERYQSAREMADALEGYLRATNETIRPEDIGKLLSSTFSAARIQLQERIRRHMGEAGAGTELGPLAGFGHAAPGVAAHAELRTTDIPIAMSATARSLLPNRRDPRAGGSRSLMFVTGAAVLMIGAAILPRRETANASLAAPAPSVGSVFIMTEPQDALVTWNGHVLGTTPGMFELPIGEHTLVLTKDDYVVEPVVLSVAPSEDGKMKVTSKAVFLRHKDVPIVPARATPAGSSRAAVPPPPRQSPATVQSPGGAAPEHADEDMYDAGTTNVELQREGTPNKRSGGEWHWTL